MTHSAYPAPAGDGVFFRAVLRMYDICTTARKTPTTLAGTRMTIEAPETCVTYGIPAISSHAGPKNVVQIGARFWRFFCRQVALRGRHSPGFTLDGPRGPGNCLTRPQLSAPRPQLSAPRPRLSEPSLPHAPAGETRRGSRGFPMRPPARKPRHHPSSGYPRTVPGT